MDIGMIGLGKMGGNMAERLRLGGHQVVGFDFSAEAVARIKRIGQRGRFVARAAVRQTDRRPSHLDHGAPGQPVDETIAKLEPLLNKGDILIDGGNSNYKDTQRADKE